MGFSYSWVNMVLNLSIIKYPCIEAFLCLQVVFSPYKMDMIRKTKIEVANKMKENDSDKKKWQTAHARTHKVCAHEIKEEDHELKYSKN
jgi:hypothetical protein